VIESEEESEFSNLDPADRVVEILELKFGKTKPNGVRDYKVKVRYEDGSELPALLGNIKADFPGVVEKYLKENGRGKKNMKVWEMPPRKEMDAADRIITVIWCDSDWGERKHAKYQVVWDHGWKQEGVDHDLVQKRGPGALKAFWEERNFAEV